MNGADRFAEARDYLVGSTYRKEVLQGALWKRLHDQLLGQPSDEAGTAKRTELAIRQCRGLALGRAEDGGPDRSGLHSKDGRSVLSAILSYTLGAVRWEPINPIAEHRACPSPGGRFTVDASISFEGEGGVSTYRYYPRDHKLVAVESRPGLTVAPGAVAITLSSDLSRCASPYGDLAYCLSTIEAGAVLAQLVLMLGEFDLRVSHVELSLPKSSSDTVPSLTLHLPAPAIAAWLEEAPPADISVLEETYRAFDRADHPLLDALLDCSTASGKVRDPFDGELAAAYPNGIAATLLEATAARSSGLDMMAGPGVNRAPDRPSLCTMLDAASAMHESFSGLERHGVRLDVTVPEALAVDPAAHWRLAPGSSLSIDVLPRGSDRAWGHIHPPGAVIATISADYRDYLDRFGALALFNMYLATGVLAQIICLASAAAGLVCRPMRSFDHASADALLPIDHWSVLQLIIYADRTGNPAFPVAAAS